MRNRIWWLPIKLGPIFGLAISAIGCLSLWQDNKLFGTCYTYLGCRDIQRIKDFDRFLIVAGVVVIILSLLLGLLPALDKSSDKTK